MYSTKTNIPNKSKYKTYKNGNGVKEYDHLDEWKQVFKPGQWHQYSNIDSLLKPTSDKTYSATTGASSVPASTDEPQEAHENLSDRLQEPDTTLTTRSKPKSLAKKRSGGTDDRFTIGDMPEWYQILEKYVRKKKEKHQSQGD